MFTIIYGWRKWRGERLQWLLLVLSFAIFSSLISILLHSGYKLLNSTPGWVNSKSHFVTVGRSNISDDFVTISGNELNKLRKLQQIDDVAKLAFRKNTILINDDEYRKSSIIYYGNNFFGLLGSPSHFMSLEKTSGSGVFVSHSFWQIHLSSIDELGDLVITVNPGNRKYRIEGVLPQEMNAIGNEQPRVWIPDSELAYTLPIMFSSDKGSFQDEQNKLAMVKAMIQGFPLFYGIAKLNQEVSPESLVDGLNNNENAQKNDGISVTMMEEKQETKIVTGVEFSPKSKSIIVRQWWLSFVLLIGFGLLNTLNFLNVATSRLIARKSEFEIKIALGIRNTDIFVQMIIEQLPMIALIIVGGVAIGEFFQQKLLETDIYSEYFGANGVEFNLLLWLASTFLIVLFVLFCSCLPLINLIGSSFFSRSKSGQTTKVQTRTWQINSIFQIALSIFALVAAGGMFYSEWQHNQNVTINKEAIEIRVLSRKPIDLDLDVEQKKISQFDNLNVTFSDSHFISPKAAFRTLAVDGMSKEEKFITRNILVTPNYFDFLNISIIAGGDILNKQGVIINQATADVLLNSHSIIAKDYTSLIGQSITLEGLSKGHYRIQSIVSNAPHYGVVNKNIPVVYTHISNAKDNSGVREFSVFANQRDINLLVENLKQWAVQELSQAKVISKGNIENQLVDVNEAGNLLFTTAASMSLLIIILMALSLYYQNKGQLELQMSRIGTMMAIGSSPARVHFEIGLRTFFLTLAAIPISLATIYFVSPFLAELIGDDWLSIMPVIIGITLVIILVQLTTYIPVRILLRRPISKLLQYMG